MTTVIGILNKRAVAIAADSAVTIGDSVQHKILNDADKIFALSKQHPVGIMIYSSANFMLTPWETIIKMYRKQLGSKFFPTLSDYKNDFFAYLSSKLSQFSDKSYEEALIINITRSFWESVSDELFKNKDEHAARLTNFIKETDVINSTENINIELKDAITIESFNLTYSETIWDIFKDIFKDLSIEYTESMKSKIIELSAHWLKTDNSADMYSGLVFAGYGDDEVYPSIISTIIEGAFFNKVKYCTKHSDSITNKETGLIKPYAQTDVIQTIIGGISPVLERANRITFLKVLNEYNRKIKEVAKESPKISKAIADIDTKDFFNKYSKVLAKWKEEKFTQPLELAISYLSKKDLAEMAESLVHLTYLQRRMTNNEESVGGPVDVAIISKGEGFIWIKRKHYFKPELNPHYFENNKI